METICFTFNFFCLYFLMIEYTNKLQCLLIGNGPTIQCVLKTQIFDKNEFPFEILIRNVFCVVQLPYVEDDKLKVSCCSGLWWPLVAAEESLPWDTKRSSTEEDSPPNISGALRPNDMCKVICILLS